MVVVIVVVVVVIVAVDGVAALVVHVLVASGRYVTKY